MSVRVGRVFIATACLIWLAGCETTSNTANPGNPFQKFSDVFSSQGSTSDGDVTGTVPASPGSPPDAPPLTPELLGSDPNDDLSIGKKYFRQGSYGLAERHFRKAVELHSRDAEAWVGLAAAYDRLRRFDLADRAYTQAIRLVGATPEILNNQGFSYMLRGDYGRARTTLLAARAKDPKSPHIAANLRMLDESARKAKAVN
jgi:tetratricopeptide (TPR) repeat protein